MNNIIKYHNYMNSLKFNGFTSVDFNFLMALCSRMRDKDTNEIVFSFEELREITGYTRTSLKVFADDIMRMNDKLMKMNCKLEQDGEIFQFVLFPTFATNVKKQTLTVAVNEKFKFILNDLVKNFTRFDLKEFVELQSKYAKNLYRLLKQWRGTGQYIFNDINQFRDIMDVPEAYSSRRLWEKIITPAVKELSSLDKSFINFQCEPIYAKKRGKPLTGYKFTWEAEKTDNHVLEPKELPVAAELSELRKELTQEEKDKLVSKFGMKIVEDYIQRTKAYKCCNYATIRQWILEDRNKKPKSSNQFNNFMQREVTQEEMDELEKALIAN